jgi:hypothetical protein
MIDTVLSHVFFPKNKIEGNIVFMFSDLMIIIRKFTLIGHYVQAFNAISFLFFANEFFLISTNQAGFRKGHSTTDNLFVLYSLISLYQSLGTKLCCTFVDFRKTFDTVWRSALAKKLQNSGIKGKIVSHSQHV